MTRVFLLVVALVAAGCMLFVGSVYVIATYGWTGVAVIVAWFFTAIGIVAFVNVGASAEGQGRPSARSQGSAFPLKNRRTS